MNGLLGGFLTGWADERDNADAKARQAKLDAQLEAISGAGAYQNGASYAQPASDAGVRPRGNPGQAAGLIGLVDRSEGGGDYSTLFGHSQRAGGRFAGMDVSKMTLGELYAFTDPNGEYGQWVKSTNPQGVVATPLGRYQIVGSTLRRTAGALGLPDDTVFSPGVQDRMFGHLANARLSKSDNMNTKIAELRSEWHGFKGIPDAELAHAIEAYEAKNDAPLVVATIGARRPI